MNKMWLVAITLISIVIAGAATASAQDLLGGQGRVRARIHTMGALGYGLAVSQSEPMNFELIKIGVAKVSVGLTEEEEEEVLLGRLYFGEEKYKLKDVVIGNGTVTANIYDFNDTQKGSLSISSYPKGDKEVWAGTMSLNGANYNLYIIQTPRIWKPKEKAEKVFEYCKNNPDKCKAVMKAVGHIICDPEGNVTCGEKIKIFCEQNPEDNRCKALQLGYCRFHLENADCRNLLMQECKKNLSEEACDRLGNMYQKFAEKTPGIGKNVPAWLERIRERIRNKQQTGSEGGQQQGG